MPARPIIKMVYYANFWLNSFPAADGISNTLSRQSIVLGIKIDYNKHCHLPFGAYAQVHEDHDNSMDMHTTGAIALRPTGNNQGAYYFFSLTLGLRLNHNNWTVLPMPNNVINHLHVLAHRSPNAHPTLTQRSPNAHPTLLP
jgi:hypothetical protein